jgi:hypothetical protein
MKMRTRVSPALDRERPDAGEDVAAALGVGHHRAVDKDLQEQVVDVGARPLQAPDDRHLGRQWVGPADAVDLARIGAAHDAQQEGVALGRRGGQVRSEEIGALRGAAPHPEAGNAVLRHSSGPSP